jgi:hypothetical protein
LSWTSILYLRAFFARLSLNVRPWSAKLEAITLVISSATITSSVSDKLIVSVSEFTLPACRIKPWTLVSLRILVKSSTSALLVVSRVLKRFESTDLALIGTPLPICLDNSSTTLPFIPEASLVLLCKIIFSTLAVVVSFLVCSFNITLLLDTPAKALVIILDLSFSNYFKINMKIENTSS